jgi:hypothetical protein
MKKTLIALAMLICAAAQAQKIDFTQQGGFPLSQDILGDMQTSYENGIAAAASAGGKGPVIISGFQQISGGYTAGWVLYNGELLQFIGLVGTPIISPGQVAVVKIIETDAALTFFDGTTKNVIKSRFVGITSGTNTSDSTQFPLSALAPYGREAAVSSMVVSAGGIAGTIYYRKNTLANTLQLYGTLTATAASLTASQIYTGSGFATGPLYYQMGTLPTGYIPNTTVPFVANVRYHENLFEDDLGSGYITQLNGEVTSTGGIAMGWRKPSAGITSYSVSFNIIIPLD